MCKGADLYVISVSCVFGRGIFSLFVLPCSGMLVFVLFIFGYYPLETCLVISERQKRLIWRAVGEELRGIEGREAVSGYVP